jgi:hypothetical protein
MYSIVFMKREIIDSQGNREMEFYTKALQLYSVLLTKQCDVFPQIKFTLSDVKGRLCREMSVCLEKHDDDAIEYVYHFVTSRDTGNHRLNSTTHRIEHLNMNLISNELLLFVNEMLLNPLIFPVCNITCKMFVVIEDAPSALRDVIYRLTSALKDPIVVRYNNMMTVYFEGLIL